jgi:hypothetical protein
MAAIVWVRAENSKLSPDYVTTLIRLNEWTIWRFSGVSLTRCR